MSHSRQMHFGVFWVGTGNHLAGWRHEGAATSNSYWPAVVESVQIAERGKLDMFFVADSVAMEFDYPPSFLSRHEPTTLLAALSMVTSRIGLGGTVSTSFSEPYNVARAFASIDNISGGRAAWNVVTSSRDAAALNFNQDRINEHDLRYEVANEFVDVVRGLWDTWEDGAIVADKKTGKFLDQSKVHFLNHKGRFFSVRGPLNIERCPQGHPIIIQAGGSPPGQELSARVADVVFSVVNGDTELAKANYNSLKQRMTKYGREPHELAVLPGVMPIVGETDEQAKEQLALLQSWMQVDEAKALSVLSQRLHFDFSGYSLDAPVPEIPETHRGQTFNKTLLSMARREKMTLRELFNVGGAARGHWAVYGSPKRIADIFEEWFVGGMADGFVLLPPHFPSGLADFVNLVVPELQRRGLFRTEYSGSMLRDHLGLKRAEPRFAAQTNAAE
jgi:FMN-dependent oxidoreductase (nitrilotriacetate monooxygenase family)